MISISSDKRTVVITFKNGPELVDSNNCLNLLQDMLLLSKSFEIAKNQKACVGKKLNKTSRIRNGIKSLVDKTNVTPATVDNLIYLIRQGKLNKIKTLINGKEIKLDYESDTAKIFVDLSLNKN
ncbi:MAG: hypothetical protein UR85_C0004G0009 [Candidatus Nomurabacteria bacterium GW2011_GWF2_35_66]|uniref:Uncharacterized protein n=1 Tax=Candidatus Nomurabacteria bacterium GW2011_GWE1_35_16 TaxID=1618761 RepID=A0A0G0BBQ9_9BACT|nr:MAG: hypothetical protein UR55_C0002G0008 [Candidatus Nomurabacteria bacterium GW2011_GWF1_34_20]KKP63587.1 MAG: hypothetical protein UR57_C0002G0008 [Candidatus Nomurabacteria bacterium GW2011_GWE2_34_25]KKP66789.1 MAG: hypothetical protein UR64_C0002G0005 [Candidatus Nomurabacteria bacterium GW2011_GWE1_35_16]KKP83415.1 MAG: hypothetical protein UR85_C0004G0009 [Candidatus Nomurabacteria bacterium GW2011_GWF2_35_66]HAE36651.1 hypothetical protein [Candidatus Nomurabacteria bacterium]